MANAEENLAAVHGESVVEPLPSLRTASELWLGPRTKAWLLALVVLQIWLSDQVSVSRQITGLKLQIWVAVMWAGWSTSVWLLVRQPLRVRRCVLLGVLLAWHSLLMWIVRDQPPGRYLFMLGSYGLVQGIAAVLLRLPEWRLAGEPNRSARPVIQFNILAIVAITTTVAGLMVVQRRYAPEATPGFFSGTALMTGLMVLVSIVAVGFGARRRLSPLGVPAVAGLAAATGWVATFADNVTAAVPFNQVWWIYSKIICVFGWMLWFAAVCGSWDTPHGHDRVPTPSTESADPPEPPDTPEPPHLEGES